MNKDDKERVLIIVDGSNFYYCLKRFKFNNLLSFDYGKFSQYLIGQRFLASKNYYVGDYKIIPRDKKYHDVSFYEEYNNPKILHPEFMNKLAEDGWQPKIGCILENNGVSHEKGVDVQMAVDLVSGAYDNLYDTVILVSSDTDLVPALVKVRSMKKKIEYVGFSCMSSTYITRYSDKARLLTKYEVEQFFNEKFVTIPRLTKYKKFK
ncbi:MAG: hypothetical protein CVT89_02105 [Candidatus Altiarchaeales archaeon HGW-Altiarchaeales-2]|nr:MAG: hypothetical protein CVT89_02105 [Candidatus Altiarchaeales archaeon HGW-Altiarchaeales-2]